MGIFDALNTSVGGLQAQSFALQNISGNIANASTVGYKGINTIFEDLIPDATTPNKQTAGGVTALAQQTITSQGTVSTTTVATNMAINGDGFFSVQKPTSVVDNVPQFSGAVDYTRRGDFQVNANGNLVNGAGYYLMGVTVDPKTGNPTGSVPTVLQFQNNFIPAQATTVVTYGANLPTQPKTVDSATAPVGTITAAGGLNPANFVTDPLPVGQTSTFFTDNPLTGATKNSQAATPINTNTVLFAGAAGSNSISPGFVAGDSIVVDGTTINFSNSPTNLSTDTINVNDTLGTLLTAIGNAEPTGTPPPTISAGAITLHTGTAATLTITAGTANATSALGSLGLTAAPTLTQNGTPTTVTGTGDVTANDLTTFTNESISGGAVTAFNSAGTPVNLQLRWALVDSASLGAGHQNVWNLFYQTSTTATNTQVAWVNAGTNFTFNANGALTSPTGPAVTVPNVSVNGQSLGTISVNIGSGALTQFANTNGAVTVNTLTQNGFAAGQLQTVAVDNSGLVVGTFSNGQNIDLAQVTLSHFNGTNFLKALDGGAYAVTNESGPAIQGASGTIAGSSLEQSNTDIADQFTKLIVTQQAYSANTKVITTANDMVQSLLAVVR